MPAGVIVYVDEGFAVIDFVDVEKRGPGLRKLLDHTPPELVDILTRSGPRRMYRVPEGNAREAGLLDGKGHDKRPPSKVDTGHADALVAAADPGGNRPADPNVSATAHATGGTITGPLRPNKAVAEPAPAKAAPKKPAATKAVEDDADKA
jgi:hypothetical protein